MKNKKAILFIGIIISIISFLLTFMYYKSNNRLTIYTSDNSYAYKYAKKNMINTYNVSDSHYKYFHRVWEDFKFKDENDGLIITKYEGASEELIIPSSYNNKKIIKIEKDALPSNVKSIFLPDSIETIETSDYSDIEILCYKGNKCDELKENKKLKVHVLDDNDRYVLDEKDLEFTYDIINDNEIELTNYLSDDEIVVIPEKINGLKVTTLSFDGEGITSIFIPETVKSISGNITSKMFNKCLITSIIIIVLSLIVYCLSILLTKTYELIDKVYIYSTSVIYLIIVNCFVYIMHNNPFGSTKYLIYILICSIIYLIVSYILNIIIKNNKKFNKDIKNKNNFIKEVTLILQDYDLPELREISDMIKYSDPVSIDEVAEIEQNIKDEIKSINADNLQQKIAKLKKLITKRNTIIKNNK